MKSKINSSKIDVDTDQFTNITAIVLQVIEALEKQKNKRKSRFGKLISVFSLNFAIFAFAISIISLTIGWVFFDVSPLKVYEEQKYKKR